MFTRIILVEPDEFSDWLREYFFELNNVRFPKETHKAERYAGRFELDFIPRLSRFKERKYKGEVRGIYYKLDRISDQRLGSRIEVTFDCRTSEAEPYFNDLIAEINRRWPVTEDDTPRHTGAGSHVDNYNPFPSRSRFESDEAFDLFIQQRQEQRQDQPL